MIAADQPAISTEDLLVAMSSIEDGTMLDRTIGIHDQVAVANRQKFCELVGTDYKEVVYQNIIYGSDQSYTKIMEVGQADTAAFVSDVHADALFTDQVDVGLFLPVADCVASVICDPIKKYLAMVHLGRHSTVAGLMAKVMQKFIDKGSSPENLIVWMSPSAKRQTYVMEWFDQQDDSAWQGFFDKLDDGIYLDLPGFNREVCLRAGVPEANIHISPINTMTSQQYFSNSMGDASGRFAVLACMRN